MHRPPTLLGVIVEHVMAVLYGIGANGKTTLIETIRKVFGDYAAPVDSAILLDRWTGARSSVPGQC
jgi:putative DNA primase/helicase